MKRALGGGVALAAIAAVSTPAFAQEGWYARADIGYSFDNSKLGISGAPFGDSEFDEDWNQSVGLGYAFASGVRLEGEISHRWNPMEGTITVRDGSDVRAWAGMINAYYDFSRGAFQPYLGFGVGAASIEANVTNPAATAGFDSDSSGFAWQAMAGVAVPLSEQLAFDIGYRFFAAPNLEYDGSVGGVSRSFEADYEQHSVMAGLRWTFAAPPPPPPPPAPPAPPPPPPPPPVATCPAADFVVYFEWDRSNLNQAALETIDAAVARAHECNLGSVTVTGHTDTSGSAQYNIGLSERRASVVRDALVARGMPGGAITTQARGENDLARATADGVREPLNRRTAVTITFR